MPGWQPNWEDVRFDHAGAQEAAAQCDGCAAFLDGRHAALGPAIAAARVEWRGVHRERFDDETVLLDHEARVLADELRLTAARIRADADAARQEQRRREFDRERWLEERAREEAEEAVRVEAARAEAVRLAAAPPPAVTPVPVNRAAAGVAVLATW